jgi:hypothetical protein
MLKTDMQKKLDAAADSGIKNKSIRKGLSP